MSDAKVIARFARFRPLVATARGVILARGADIFELTPDSDRPVWTARLPLGDFERRSLRPRLLQRVVGAGPQCGVEAGEGRLTIASKKNLYGVDLRTNRAHVQAYEGKGRPLKLVRIRDVPGFTDQVCFGEYLGNPAKAPVTVWGDGGEGAWRPLHVFADGEIEHVHTLVPDPQRGVVWILVGDFGQAAGIWMARDDFRVVEPVLRGSQRYRAAEAFPTADGLVYATDSQLEPNSIRLLRERDGRWVDEQLASLPGSCIHACMVGDRMCFSTTVEPGLGTGFLPYDLLQPRIGPAIERRWSDVVVGDPERGFARVGTWRKDVWPMGLCGFGTISFVSGVLPAGRLVAYGTALRGFDDATLVFSI